jgi:hypothetical protein
MIKTVTIGIEAKGSEVGLSDGRTMTVRRPPVGVLDEPSWPARRPGWGNARGHADRLIGASLEPRMTATEVGALTPRDRQRLMLEAVRMRDGERDWRALYGSSLSSDERFCATMRWAQRREFEALRSRLCKAREAISIGSKTELAAISKSFTRLGSSPTIAARMGIAGSYKMPMMRMAERGAGDSLATYYKSFGIGQMTGLQKTMEQAMGLGTLKEPFTASKAAEIASLTSPLGSVRLGADLSRINDSFATGLGLGLKGTNSTLLRSILGGSASPMLGAGKLSGITGAGLIRGPLMGSGIGEMMRKDVGLALTGLGAMSSFDALRISRGLPGFGGGFTEEFRRTIDGLIVVEYRRIWSGDPMWFLLSHLSPRELPQLLGQGREQVYEAVLDGLEEVVLKTPVIAALRVALDSMPFLSEEQRQWLEHGLEHAERGEWLQAVPPLLLGYEGGLYNSAIDAKAIPKTSRGKLMAAEKIIKAFELEDALEAFALKLVFGGRGNSFRHGRPGNQARDQVLLMVVAIVAWVDFLFDTHGTERLVRELHDPLERALERGEATGLPAVG